VSGGRKAQAAGAALERFLIESCEWLNARGRCEVARIKPPYKNLGPLSEWLHERGLRIEGLSDGLFVAVYSGAPSVDFEGDLKGGLSVAFDAKSSGDKTAFRFDLVTDAQLEHLRKRAALGKLCFVYARKTLAPVADFVIPVDRLARIAGVTHKRSHDALLGAGRESVQWGELAEQGLRVQPGEYWLDTVARILAASRWPMGGA
jgi:hypothetical protein